MKHCPYCGEEIRDEAKKCRYCGEWLDDAGHSADQPARPAASEEPMSPTPPPFPAQQPAVPAPPQTVIAETLYEQVPQSPQPQQPPQTPIYSGQEVGGGYFIEETRETPMAFFNKYFAGTFFRQYADFTSRISRGDFWHSVVANMVVCYGLYGVAMFIGALCGGSTDALIALCIAGGIYGLALFIPGLAFEIRRLRDAGHSWPMFFLSLIPGVGSIILLIFFCQPGIDTRSQTAPSRFKLTDWIITVAAAIAVVLGLAGLGGAFGDDSPKPYYYSETETDSITVTTESDKPMEVEEETKEADETPHRQYTYDSNALPISGHAANKYPNYNIGSDYSYELDELASRDNVRVIRGEGYISDHNVAVNGVLLPNGSIVGRYHNENGISLDVNGYVDSYTGDVKIRLGHGSETSYWTLHSEFRRGSAYQYSGEWGKKNKPTSMTFVLE